MAGDLFAFFRLLHCFTATHEAKDQIDHKGDKKFKTLSQSLFNMLKIKVADTAERRKKVRRKGMAISKSNFCTPLPHAPLCEGSSA